MHRRPQLLRRHHQVIPGSLVQSAHHRAGATWLTKAASMNFTQTSRCVRCRAWATAGPSDVIVLHLLVTIAVRSWVNSSTPCFVLHESIITAGGEGSDTNAYFTLVARSSTPSAGMRSALLSTMTMSWAGSRSRQRHSMPEDASMREHNELDASCTQSRTSHCRAAADARRIPLK